MIPEEVIQKVRDTANIREIVEEYVPLRKAGRNWVGLCPFHSENDPSFTVSEEKQLFHCFGCNEGGDIFRFLMKLKGLSFIEAVKYLAERYGIDIPQKPLSKKEKEKRKEKDLLLKANKEASLFYHNLLLNSPEGEKGLNYLFNRGIKKETIISFKIGWAPESWDRIVNYLKNKNITEDIAQKAGLIVKRSSSKGYYDRFRSRIIFPIEDINGDIVAIGGRVIDDGLPKYLNSPETPIYQKSHILYGLYKAKEAIRKKGTGIVVEGYLDLISLFQQGIENVVATLGTALTTQHITLLKKHARNWILIFDGDSAGIKAALRALPLFFKASLNVKVLNLPDNHDPDSFIRTEGKEKFLTLLEKAPSGLDFAINKAIEQHKNKEGLLDIERKLDVIETLIPILSAVEDPVLQSLMVGKVAQILSIREESLLKKLRIESTNNKPSNLMKKDFEKRPINKAEEQLIGFLLLYPEYQKEFLSFEIEQWLDSSRLRNLWLIIKDLYYTKGAIGIDEIYEYLEEDSSIYSLVSKIIREFPPIEDKKHVVKELKEFCNKKRIKILREQLLEQLKESPFEEQTLWLKRLKELQE